jgi:4-hydroxybenzoate polyprenyltransferase
LTTQILPSLKDSIRLGRLHIASVGAFPYLIGYTMHGYRPGAQVALFWCCGLTMHALGCSVNDIADHRTDAIDPSRQATPLVSGSTSVRQAVAFSVLMALLAVATAYLALGLSLGLGVMFILLIVNVYGNAMQKRFRGIHVYLMDWLFGVLMATPFLLASALAGASLTPGPVLVAASFACFSSMVNVIGGNLKDLEHDYRNHIPTAATQFGVRPGTLPGMCVLTMRHRIYASCYFLGATSTQLGALLLWPAEDNRSLMVILGATLLTATTVGFARFLARDQVRYQSMVPMLMGPLFVSYFVIADNYLGMLYSIAVLIFSLVWIPSIRRGLTVRYGA